MNRVVIIGAGFGGLACARELADTPAKVTLVDQNNFHTFLPLLYQVATSGLNAADIAYPVRSIFAKYRNIRFRRGLVTSVDKTAKLVHFDDGTSLEYDSLVIAVGAQANYFGIEGVEEHGFALYSLSEAVALRNQILNCYEAAEANPEQVEDGALTFVVVGGGPTGVEMAGALIELIHKVLAQDFRGSNFNIEASSVVLVEMQDRLLAPFSKTSQRYALKTLLNRGVDVRTGVAISAVTDTRIELTDGSVIASHTLIWAAGVKAAQLAEQLDVETVGGSKIGVDQYLRVESAGDDANLYAIGDVCAFKKEDGTYLAGVAPVAIQQGRYLGKRLAQEAFGDPVDDAGFTYHDRGSMSTIGRRAAVAELANGIKLKGTAAWTSWLALHLIYLMGFRNRASVFVNWVWNYITWERGARFILSPGELKRKTATPTKTDD